MVVGNVVFRILFDNRARRFLPFHIRLDDVAEDHMLYDNFRYGIEERMLSENSRRNGVGHNNRSGGMTFANPAISLEAKTYENMLAFICFEK